MAHRPKFSRVKQSWRPALVLQERDIDFIRAAEEFRLLSTPQYFLLFPTESRAAIYRRLQTLYHHAYLDRLKGDPSAPMVYALGTRGAEVLVERGILKEVTDFSKKNREIQNRYIAHQGMITNFRIALVLATRDRPDLELAIFKREGVSLHDRVTAVYEGRSHTIPVYPDGYFSLHFPTHPQGKNRAHFFLEADRSTMTLARLQIKLAGYWHWYRQGGHTRKHDIRAFRVLTITRSEERMQNLLKIAKQVDDQKAGSPMFCFTSETRYSPEQPHSIFEAIWETPNRPGEQAGILPAEKFAQPRITQLNNLKILLLRRTEWKLPRSLAPRFWELIDHIALLFKDHATSLLKQSDSDPDHIRKIFSEKDFNFSHFCLMNREQLETFFNHPLLKPIENVLDKLDDTLITTAMNQAHLFLGHIPETGDQLFFHYFPDRFKHTYIIGKTGSGKTTLLKNIISQDLRTSCGVIVISPEDGLFQSLLSVMPKSARDSLIYFEPTDTSEPFISFSPFHLEEGEDLTQKAGETYTIFERALGDLAPRMATLIQNIIYALLQRPNSSFADFDLLLDPNESTLRKEIVESPQVDERTKKFWRDYDESGYYKASHDPVLNRIDSFLRPPLSLTLAHASFSFNKVLNEKDSILFCNLSRLRGLQAQLVGQLLFAQIQQTFIRRDFMPEDKRIPYFIYIDEFQTYAQGSEQSFIEMLNRFRKYKVALTMAHQVTADIPSKLLSSIVGNAGTIVSLQISAEDAPFFAKELQVVHPSSLLKNRLDSQHITAEAIMEAIGRKELDAPKYRPELLQNLPIGEAYIRTPSFNRGIHVKLSNRQLLQKSEIPIEELKTISKKNFGKKREPAPPKVIGQASQPQPQELKKPEDFLE